MDANKLWISSKQKLKGSFSKAVFDIYFNDVSIPIKILDGTLYLKGNKNTKRFFEDEHKNYILEVFNEFDSNIRDIRVLLDDKNEDFLLSENNSNKFNSIKEESSIIDIANSIARANLNPKYTFDTFVVGSSNNIAFAACQRVSESDEIYNDNPLFLYGGSGLGKTHLMHAIGHRIIERDPSKTVLYVTSETFFNDLVLVASRKKTNIEFREKYRNVDVFMVDDIQFASNKNTLQEELFHTFNEAQAAGKKIIFSSDKPPKDIKGIEERLKSRFMWGLMVDIQSPDYGTRVAILETKAESLNITLPKEVIEYIADNVKSNIRELESSLNKLIAYKNLVGKEEITLDIAKEALKDIIVSYSTSEINILRIKEMVADAYNVKVDDLNSKKRNKAIAFPRQVAMYIARNLLDISLPSIGDDFGGRDHTTVMHAIKKIEDEIDKSEMLKVKIEKIISDLRG